MSANPIGFRPNAEDQRILDSLASEGHNATTALRRGLRLLDQERWTDQARADAARLSTEDLRSEPDAW